MYTQHYFLGNTHMGQSERNWVRVHEQLVPPLSVAFFCPYLGEVWFRGHIDNREYAVIMRKKDHSLLLSWDPDWNLALPHAVLLREATLSLKDESYYDYTN